MTTRGRGAQEESWTRDAYYRAAINCSAAIVEEMERETARADAAIVAMQREMEEHRSERSHKRRRSLDQEYAEDEEKLRKERLHDIYSQFPLASLDEKSEFSLRIHLRSVLMQKLSQAERRPEGGSSGLYLVPRGPPPPEDEGSHNAASTNPLRDLHIAEFESSMTDRSDERIISNCVRRLRLLEGRRETLAAKTEVTIAESHALQAVEGELKRLSAQKKHYEEVRVAHKAAAAKHIAELRRRATVTPTPILREETPETPLPRAAKEALTQPTLPNRVLSVPSSPQGSSPTLATLSQAGMLWGGFPVARPARHSTRGFEVISLPERNLQEDEEELQRFLWPTDIERAIPHALSGVVEEGRSWRALVRPSAEASDAFPSGLPGTASKVWLHVESVGDFLSNSASIQ